MTTNFANEYPGEKLTVHIDHAATVTARMPTAEECARRGLPPDVPMLVIDGGPYGEQVHAAHLVALVFDDPHGQPRPDAARDAALYVLGIIGRDLELAGARIGDLRAALKESPCHVGHLAAEVREEQEDAWHCPDASMCTHDADQGTDSYPRVGHRAAQRAAS